MIALNWKNLIGALRHLDKEKDFPSIYTLANSRKNYHVLKFKGLWSVHPETTKETKAFPDRETAAHHACECAQADKTVAFVHNEDGSIAEAWAYGIDAFPQEKLHAPERYPLKAQLSKTVL